MKVLARTFERVRSYDFLRDLLIVCMSSIALALMGQIKVNLPFTPVLVVLQNKAVLLAGLLLGARRGFLAALLLLAQAFVGLPALAGLQVGAAVFFGAKAGYLIAYPLSAYVVGWISERYSQTSAERYAALSAGLFVQFFLGCAVLSKFIGISSAIWVGFVPFIVTDLLFNIGSARYGKKVI